MCIYLFFKWSKYNIRIFWLLNDYGEIMTYHFNVDKEIQAVGVLLRREGKIASRLRVLMLLYIVDRKSMEEIGRFMLGSRFIAEKYGPVNTKLMELINGGHINQASWSRYFRNVGKDIVLEPEEPGIGKLNRYEIQSINEIIDIRTNRNDWEIANEMQQFQEWKKNYKDSIENPYVLSISIEDIIEAVGLGKDKKSILKHLKETEALDKFFNTKI